MEKQPQLHTIAPVYDENSRILILGSFPSVKSREAAFFYGHPQNRFWRVLAAVLGEEAPQTAAEKKSLLLRHGVALWDVIASCDIAGSSDASITNVVPNDLSRILDAAPVRRIFCKAARPTAFTAGMTRPYGERRRLCPPPVPPTRARPCRRSRSAGARRSRRGFDGSEPVKNVTLTC